MRLFSLFLLPLTQDISEDVTHCAAGLGQELLHTCTPAKAHKNTFAVEGSASYEHVGNDLVSQTLLDHLDSHLRSHLIIR